MTCPSKQIYVKKPQTTDLLLSSNYCIPENLVSLSLNIPGCLLDFFPYLFPNIYNLGFVY